MREDRNFKASDVSCPSIWIFILWFILWFIFKEYSPENCFLPPSSLLEKIGPHALKNLTGGLRRFRYTSTPLLLSKMLLSWIEKWGA